MTQTMIRTMTNNSIYINHKDRQTNARDPVSEIHTKRRGLIVYGLVMDVTVFLCLVSQKRARAF